MLLAFLAMCQSNVLDMSARICVFALRATCVILEITFCYSWVLWQSVSASRLTTKYHWKVSDRRSWCCQEMHKGVCWQNLTLIIAFHSEVKWICLTSEWSCYVALNVESYVEQCRHEIFCIPIQGIKKSWNWKQDWCCINKPSLGRLPS